jgi:hypothetical protein
VHHLLHAGSGSLLTLRFVRLRNCFKEPEDMYSVINMTCNKKHVLRYHVEGDRVKHNGLLKLISKWSVRDLFSYLVSMYRK